MAPTGSSARGVAAPVLAAPLALALASVIGLALGSALGAAGCARDRGDTRAARFAAERYLDALGRNDLTLLRQRSTCAVPARSIAGGIVLRVETPRTATVAMLDSLARSAATVHRTLDSLWTAVPEQTVDSLFLRSQLFARRHVLYRNALRAVSLSLDGEEPPADALIRTCRVRARIRYHGQLVGPKAIDREHVLRLLAAPGGRWIVFSGHVREDDPRPEPI